MARRGTRGRVPVFEYTPREPSASAVYAVVWEHVEGFLAEATRVRDGHGLPRFVDDEFRAFPCVSSGTYYLRLTASNAAGTSAPSNQVAVTVP